MSTLRPARPGDAAALDAFLAPLSDTSMFLRGNIRAHGVCGGAADFATRIWLDRERGAIVGVIGLTTSGMVLVQMPSAQAQGMQRAARTLRGALASGVAGEAGQVRAFRAAAGLDRAAARDKDEPLYALDLAELELPRGPGGVRAPGPADAPLLEAWRAAYDVEALGVSPQAAADSAPGEVARMIEARACRVIEHDGAPVGMTAVNTALPEAVQVGGVYTPPEFRGRGFARRAVALHLHELRSAGVRRAVLFAASSAACRAYEAVGFRRVGTYALVLFAEPAAIGAGA
jgi:RimJ/RimL family protein N-acetyltransferase